MEKTLQRINALDKHAREKLASPMVRLAAPGVSEAVLELLEIVRAMAVDLANVEARQRIFENQKGGWECGEI